MGAAHRQILLELGARAHRAASRGAAAAGQCSARSMPARAAATAKGLQIPRDSTEISVVLPPEKASKPHDQPIIRMPKLRGRAAGGIRWVLPHSEILSKCGCPDNPSPNPLPVQAIRGERRERRVEALYLFRIQLREALYLFRRGRLFTSSGKRGALTLQEKEALYLFRRRRLFTSSVDRFDRIER